MNKIILACSKFPQNVYLDIQITKSSTSSRSNYEKRRWIIPSLHCMTLVNLLSKVCGILSKDILHADWKRTISLLIGR